MSTRVVPPLKPAILLHERRCSGASLIAGWVASKCPGYSVSTAIPAIFLPRLGLKSKIHPQPLPENKSRYPKNKPSLLSSRTMPLGTLAGA